LGTGNTTLPAHFDLTSTSAGDMFLGAFIPGLVLVGLYVLYILVVAMIKPKMAPPTPFEGRYDRKFASRVFLVLVPPLTLILAVLGSIVLGIATVNQAGAIGAMGAMIMAGYRLMEGKRGAFTPAILAVISVAALATLLNFYDINIKAIKNTDDVIGVVLATIASIGLLTAIIWSGWRAYHINDTLNGVMVETAKTTSLVFIILLGAAMLTAAFRAFGGEELVRDFLTGLPGGFISKFVVVMLVIFLLGFFLDFIEIAVVVVPIIAPILLADPSANVTAVWLGVMIGVNMQTSFLTPPFGFALFYLRGVAPPEVKTIEMYKGVVPFIALQLVGLAIVGAFPALVNYLPNKVYLTSETAPPPKNPRLQVCLEEYLFEQYIVRGDGLRAAIKLAKTLDISYLPGNLRTPLEESFVSAQATFGLVEKVRAAEAAVAAYVPDYRPIHTEMRELRVEMSVVDRELKELDKTRRNLSRDGEESAGELKRVEQHIDDLKQHRAALEGKTPVGWEGARKRYADLSAIETKARRKYRRNVDDAYELLPGLRKIILQADALAKLEERLRGLESVIANDPPAQAIETIKAVEKVLGAIAGTSSIKSKLSKARRALRGSTPKREKAAKELAKGLKRFTDEVTWRRRAGKQQLVAGFDVYDNAIKDTIGLRSQERLSSDQAEVIATCQSTHRDISLDF
jgi:TRAP-type mannitol/chloroaromatic compound transport system permease large subunit